MVMERLRVYNNGSRNEGGKLITKPKTFQELTDIASKKFHIIVKKVYSSDGDEIEDTDVLRDDDVIFVSSGEPFIKSLEGIVGSRPSENVASKKPKVSLPLRKGNSFRDISEKVYFVDKTMVIREIFGWFSNGPNKPIEQARRPLLIYAPRRFGKTTVLDLLECFFGGGLPRNDFSKFMIGKDRKAAEAFKWYDKFSVIYINFAFGLDIVRSREECVISCRMILHECFKTYQYVLEHISVDDKQVFEKWCHEEKFLEKQDSEVLIGLRFLVECIIDYAKRPVFLLIDEFDNICAHAMYNTSEDHLFNIIGFHAKMIANVVKHDPIVSGAVFTGITPITCPSYSDLNNPFTVNVLSNETYCKFYGILIEEFEEVMTREGIPQNTKTNKEEAIKWYNGYSYKNYSILNPYSVANFIESSGEVEDYWRKSGMAIGLSKAIRQDDIRIELTNTVLSDEPLKICLKNFSAKNFTLLNDDRFQVSNANFVYNFLLQQGYFTLVSREGEGDTQENKILVKIPNVEVKREFHEEFSDYYSQVYNFDPKKIEECFVLFRDMNFSNKTDCKTKMESFKKILVKLLSNESPNHMNESWLECFLYSIFYQSAEVKSQIKVEETAVGNDLRTAKVLDLFVKIGDKIFILEETMICTGEKGLEKLIEKQYYLKVGECKSYMLIGIGVNKNQDALQLSDITISFLVNSFKGDKINV